MRLSSLPSHHSLEWLSDQVDPIKLYDEVGVKAYSQACREQAIEDVISAIEAANARRVIYLPDVIEIIRSLK